MTNEQAPAPCQFLFRSAKLAGLQNCAPNYESVLRHPAPSDGSIRYCAYSPDGTLFGLSEEGSLKVFDAETGDQIASLDTRIVCDFFFSPLNTFIVSWERPFKQDDGLFENNVKIWKWSEGVIVGSWLQKNLGGWKPQFTPDEEFIGRLVTNEIQIYKPNECGQPPVHRLRVEAVSEFSFSPAKSLMVAAFTPEKKGAPAVVRIFSLPPTGMPLTQKTFFKAEDVQLMWNKNGTSLLVLTTIELDKTNQSYYGESNLYYLGITGGSETKIHLDQEGPIYDVTWRQDGKEFAVCYGYMPAKISIFDCRANLICSLSPPPRNTIKYSPNGDFLLAAGFGNLSGTIDIYDRKTMTRLSSIEANSTSYYDWSPDGCFLMTAITSPRLRVDNGIKIWHHSGKLIYKTEMDELYQVLWRPRPLEDFSNKLYLRTMPEPDESAKNFVPRAPLTLAAAYRPPGARNSVSSNTAQQLQKTPSHTVVFASNKPELFSDRKTEMNISKVALKNMKKRQHKKEHEPDQIVNQNLKAVEIQKPTPSALVSEKDKRIRSLVKKLRAIEELKIRQENNEELELTQVQKIATEKKIQAELTSLGWKET